MAVKNKLAKRKIGAVSEVFTDGFDEMNVVEFSDTNIKQKVDIGYLQSRWQQLVDDRRDVELIWKQIRMYSLPWIGIFYDTDDKDNPYKRKDFANVDNTAWECNSVFARGMVSSLIPANKQWFRQKYNTKSLALVKRNQLPTTRIDEQQEEYDPNSTTENAYRTENIILDEITKRMSECLQESNFYEAYHASLIELSVGQAPLVIVPDKENTVRFFPLSLGTYYLDTNDKGEIDCCGWQQYMTLMQIADKFGIFNLPDNLQQLIKENQGHKEKKLVNWIVEPNRDYMVENKPNNKHKFISVYWLDGMGEDCLLSVGGYDYFPVVVNRFEKIGLRPYSRGPAWFSLSNCMQQYIMIRDKLKAVDLEVNPPMQCSASNMIRGINNNPGAFIPRDNPNDKIEPTFNVSINLNHLEELIEKNREDVRDAFFYNHLMTITNIESVERTAREIMERKLEGMQQIGPTTMLITKEGLDPALKIVYKLMKDEGLFDDLFAQLDQDELDFEIEYVSPMAQAQKYTGIQELQQLIEIAGILGGQLGYPVTDRLDGDFTLSLVADYLNVHAGVLRDMKVVKEERAAREQQQMQAAQVQQAGEFMNNAAPMVKAVSGATDNGMPALDMGGGMGGINPGV